MQQILQVREFPARTLRWWYDEQDNIDFNPSYQRKGGVWYPSQKAFLIDTILNGFDVPKIYLADFTYRDTSLNIRKKPYAVIDGKQRFEAIFGFFNDEYPLSSNFTFLEDSGINISGLRFSELLIKHPRVARIFENSSLTVMSVITSEESLINELFVRLNSSKPLTGAEVRSALTGEVPELIKSIASHVFFTDCVSFADNRKQDENLAAKLLLLEFRGKFTDTKKRHLDNLVKEHAQTSSNGIIPEGITEQLVLDAFLAETPTLEKATNRIKSVLTDMHFAFQHKDPLLKSEGPIPLYYWLARNSTTTPITYLRNFLEYFQDIRLKFKTREERIELRNLQDHTRLIDMVEMLSQYDVRSRSINDAGSLTHMYEILCYWQAAYLNGARLKMPD
ncbi:DUF262 domain-containing protein [Hymenobacter sp. B1770]|uniref:DUF262 domain-containing protein n=1 Tax=Hymenobacter sp. B1770 TaxID=1718788 RepID=UPI003CF263EB